MLIRNRLLADANIKKTASFHWRQDKKLTAGQTKDQESTFIMTEFPSENFKSISKDFKPTSENSKVKSKTSKSTSQIS